MDERRDVATEDTANSKGDAPRSKGKSVKVSETGDISPTRVDDSPVPKKRKTSEPKPDTRDFTEKTTLEKGALFYSVVKRFISKPDIRVIRELSEEKEVEKLHSSWIDAQTDLATEWGEEIERLNKSLEEEKKRWAEEKAALEQKVRDSVSQRDNVLRSRDLIIEEWKGSKTGRNFAANMGLEAAEVAAREVEAEYNAAVDAEFHAGNDSNAEFQVDDAINIGDLLGGDAPQIEEGPLAAEAPDARGGEAHEENSGVREDSSDVSSSESDDEEAVDPVLALARRSQPGIAAGTVSGEMSIDERNTLVNRLRLAQMRLSEAEEAMAKSLKAFEEKKGSSSILSRSPYRRGIPPAKGIGRLPRTVKRLISELIFNVTTSQNLVDIIKYTASPITINYQPPVNHGHLVFLCWFDNFAFC
ncbi:hypothetical protein BVRB_7g167520 [Beta vulgaris subsp. vulgaris]|nr:hypothetical protein BVRB_7g167520 [Beta vulgaris subsp. vulgaris]